MRDILVTALVFGSLPFILMRPWIGVLVWSWLSYMNPHRLTWGFAYDMPFAQIVAITLLVSFVLNKTNKRFPINVTTIIWASFFIWMVVTTVLAIYPERAFEYFDKVWKIQLITVLTVILIIDKVKVKSLVWVITMSIGFYSIKGGVFTIITGGGFRVYGPAGSFIQENNALGLSTLMIVPLMYYLWVVTNNKWLKYFLLASIFLCIVSVAGSQSRGALLALLAVLGYFWWQSSTKLISGMALIVLVSVGYNFMPASWHERMESIQNYQEDQSAMSRLDAWEYSINIANDRFTGGGFSSWSKPTYDIYSPGYLGVFVAHSIYFGVLADHGWLGLLLFMLVLTLTWRNLSVVVNKARGDPGNKDLEVLAKMIKISLVAYLSGGAFLSLSYFDLPWHLIALSVILRGIICEHKNKHITQSDNKQEAVRL